MAKKLHDTYNYGYDNLKVLLGGWNAWKQENSQNPAAYPIDSNPAAVQTEQAKPVGPSDNQTPIVIQPGASDLKSPVPQP